MKKIIITPVLVMAFLLATTQGVAAAPKAPRTHDVAVQSIYAPSPVVRDWIYVTVSVGVANVGNYTENVTV